MIRHSPCENYLKFLIVHPDGHSNEAIKEKLFELGLDDLGNYYVEKLRKRLRPPSPFYPGDRYHTKSQNFLMTEGIKDLFFPDGDTDTAYRVLDRPRIKEFVESMLIADAPFSAIAHSLTHHRKFRATERAVDLYKFYFWNVDLLDSVQIRALIQMRAAAPGGHADDDIKKQAEPLKRAAWNDPRRSAAELPHSPLSAIMAQMRMGLLPGELKLPQALAAARDMAVMTSYEALCMNGPNDHLKARNLADAVRSFTEVLEVVVKPDENMREQLQAIALRTNEQKVPHIKQLSKGQHTVDLQPKVEDENVPDDVPGPERRAAATGEGSPGGGERSAGGDPEVPESE